MKRPIVIGFDLSDEPDVTVLHVRLPSGKTANYICRSHHELTIRAIAAIRFRRINDETDGKMFREALEADRSFIRGARWSKDISPNGNPLQIGRQMRYLSNLTGKHPPRK